ncbi:MAG: hypothetical protein ACRDGV_04190 [Candidatus Limnocylindria bacterium]
MAFGRIGDLTGAPLWRTIDTVPLLLGAWLGGLHVAAADDRLECALAHGPK